MPEIAYASLTYAEACERQRNGTLQGWLLFRGIDWRTMTAKQEGDRVLYSGPRVEKPRIDGGAQP